VDARDLDEELASALPPATLATLRAGFLAGAGLLRDARQGLVEELARQPEEPTLQFLLGDLYSRQGLVEEAQESFAEVRFLMSGATQ
jgi:predicted Zn-dependent protease